mmetsp:Transcript_39761/g.78328  ORF Transcript_39761/g.78328 Transcript_39761/m.78328 type:complete len:495 (+) Transcript_39761:312-1796(+)
MKRSEACLPSFHPIFRALVFFCLFSVLFQELRFSFSFSLLSIGLEEVELSEHVGQALVDGVLGFDGRVEAALLRGVHDGGGDADGARPVLVEHGQLGGQSLELVDGHGSVRPIEDVVVCGSDGALSDLLVGDEEVELLHRDHTLVEDCEWLSVGEVALLEGGGASAAPAASPGGPGEHLLCGLHSEPLVDHLIDHDVDNLHLARPDLLHILHRLSEGGDLEVPDQLFLALSHAIPVDDNTVGVELLGGRSLGELEVISEETNSSLDELSERLGDILARLDPGRRREVFGVGVVERGRERGNRPPAGRVHVHTHDHRLLVLLGVDAPEEPPLLTDHLVEELGSRLSALLLQSVGLDALSGAGHSPGAELLLDLGVDTVALLAGQDDQDDVRTGRQTLQLLEHLGGEVGRVGGSDLHNLRALPVDLLRLQLLSDRIHQGTDQTLVAAVMHDNPLVEPLDGLESDNLALDQVGEVDAGEVDVLPCPASLPCLHGREV